MNAALKTFGKMIFYTAIIAALTSIEDPKVWVQLGIPAAVVTVIVAAVKGLLTWATTRNEV